MAPLAYTHAAHHAPLAYSSPALSYGHSYTHSAPLAYAHAPQVHYAAPVVKAIAPVHYAKHVVPAATSYANTYKVSYKFHVFQSKRFS